MAVDEEYLELTDDQSKAPGAPLNVDLSMTEAEVEEALKRVRPKDQVQVWRKFVNKKINDAQAASSNDLTLENKMALFSSDRLKKAAAGLPISLEYDSEGLNAEEGSGAPAVKETPEGDGQPVGPTEEMMAFSEILGTQKYAPAVPAPKSLEEHYKTVMEDMEGEEGELTLAKKDVVSSEIKMEDAERKYAQFSEDIRTFRINPFRLYENTLFAVTAAIAAGLGAAAQSLSGGGPNTGLEMINRAIDMDVMRQKHEYDALKDSAAKQATLYGRAVQVYGTDKKAVLALKAAGMEMADKKARLDMDKYKIDSQNKIYMNRAFADEFKTKKDALMGILSASKKSKAEENAGYRKTAENAIEQIRDFINLYQTTETGIATAVGAAFGDNDWVVGNLSKENQKIVLLHKTAKSALPLLTNAIMKTSGDKGNLGEKERVIFRETADKLIPKITLIAAFSPDAKQTAINRAELALTDLIYMLGIVDDPSQKKEVERRFDRIKKSAAIIDNLSAEHKRQERGKAKPSGVVQEYSSNTDPTRLPVAY